MIRKPIITVLGHVDAGKCVSGNTRIFLNDGTTSTIKELFEQHEEKSKKLADKDGVGLEVSEKLLVLGEENGKIEKKPISHIWKLRKKELMYIEFETGQTIEVTPEHLFPMLNEDVDFSYKPASLINEKDFVAVPHRLSAQEHSLDGVKSIIINKLAENKGILAFCLNEFVEEITPAMMNHEKNLMTITIRACIQKNRFRLADLVRVCIAEQISLAKLYDSIEFFKYSTTKKRASHKSIKIKMPKTYEGIREFCYIAGLIAGDGSSQHLQLTNNDFELLSYYTEFFVKEIGVKAKVTKDKSCFVAVNYGWKTFKEICGTLFEFAPKSKTYSVGISETLKRLPNEFIGEYISGYFDTDGYVTRNVEISTNSAKMPSDLMEILPRFGILPYMKKNKTAVRITISGKKNIELFKESIGFRLQRKKVLMNNYLSKCKSSRISDVSPITGEKIKNIRVEYGLSGMETEVPYQKKYEAYDFVSNRFAGNFLRAILEKTETAKYKDNLKDKIRVLKLLKENTLTYNESYKKLAVEHRKLANHFAFLESEGLIKKTGDNHSITEKGVKTLVKWISGANMEKIKSLYELLSSDLAFIKVKKIAKIENSEEFVYDLTQPKSHNFVANGVLVHNTKLLDSVRGTSVADKEAGGITQHIGATEVPISVITGLSGPIIAKYKFTISIPGLLFIDTPGHEAFTNLRKRGGSIADLAVLVVDVHKGLEEQALEAIEILKSYKCPFIVAANKVDTIKGWIVEPGSISDALQKQNADVLEALDTKIYTLVGQLHGNGFASERFDRVKDFTKEVAIVPVSAKMKIGIQELLVFLAALSQKYLDKKLVVHENGKCRGTVLEVREERGLGKTIDLIIYDGMLKVGEEISVGGKNGAIRAKVRALLEPRPAGEQGSDKFRNVHEVHAAAGVKVAAPGLDDALSGSPVRNYSPEAEKEINEEIHRIRIDSDAIGPIVRSNTLGSLEAIVKLLQDRGIKVKKADVGEIARKDILEIGPVAEKDRFKGVIFAFHTKVSEGAAIEAEKHGTKIFQNDVVYRILEEYEAWMKAEKEGEKKEKLAAIVMPAKFEVMPGFVFRHSGPAIVGVKVVEGKLRKGIQVMNEDGEVIGKVLGIQSDNKSVDEATKGMEVAVSIDGGVVGRNLEERDEMYSFIPLKGFMELKAVEDSFTREELDLIEEIRKVEAEKAEA
ncbi:MAG: translation initiation factor IF-2 [Candidatus Diapherotrites archaeon]|uniref:Translation initiation factor IF-2 n=1 Tax=Candidatus Iainarchaeum sp. TaxID=3101447 RepID=A0A8T3YL06_9ARCH|nr:translation initiation factor IF-2 [Candidatus Diapherotrites archaeon]